MLAPVWFKLRIGPYLRKERDKRNYFLLFTRGSAVGGFRRVVALLRSRAIDVHEAWPDRPVGFQGACVLRFHNALKDNEKKSFAQIVHHGSFLRHELLAMTKPKFHPVKVAEPFIAIHVRMGDFQAATGGAGVQRGATNTRLPIDWYGDRLTAIRRAMGDELDAVIFSDGSDAELASLLALPAVVRAPHQQSVTDLLQMGQAAALVASGSGFSLWGAFLGSTPRISFPGQSIVPISDDASRDIESDFGAEIPASFIAHLSSRLAR